MELDKLSHEIFSILENKFLHDSLSQPQTPVKPQNVNLQNDRNINFGGKVRILSIDAAEELPAAAALAKLESTLRQTSGNPTATIADFFDAAAGSGAGGVLAAMLFTKKMKNNNSDEPLFSAEEAFRFLSRNPIFSEKRGGAFSFKGMFSRNKKRRNGSMFCKMFGELTLKDAIKPVIIPCYDLLTGAPFVFSRSDSIESDGYDFKLSDVCDATTCADRTVGMVSVDGRTRINAVGNGVVMGNPTAVVITHVVNNKLEFPLVNGVEDLLVVSLGNGEVGDSVRFNAVKKELATPSRKEMLRIAGNGAADMVDQAVATAFGHNRENNYLRIQANCMGNSHKSLSRAEAMLSHNNVESVLFHGKKISPLSNAVRLETFGKELIKEWERRKSCPIPTVLVKQHAMMTPPRSSSSTNASFSSSSLDSY